MKAPNLVRELNNWSSLKVGRKGRAYAMVTMIPNLAPIVIMICKGVIGWIVTFVSMPKGKMKWIKHGPRRQGDYT